MDKNTIQVPQISHLIRKVDIVLLDIKIGCGVLEETWNYKTVEL